MFTVALTGDVGAGKSTLVRCWHALGANVVDADEVAKAQWQRPEVMEQMTARWGAAVLRDGRPDYRAIAERAFADAAENRFTNALIHPWTGAEISRRLQALRGWVVVEIPLLFEAGWQERADYIVYVTAPEERRVTRNAARGWNAEEVRRRERFLMDSAEKRKMSDVVLANDGDLLSWEQAARELGLRLRDMASVCEVVTHCGSPEDAERIASILVENRLAACVNISESRSCYRWRGEICRENEWALVCKTTERVLRRAMACIRTNHPYELPAITARELVHADAATLEWVARCCQPE